MKRLLLVLASVVVFALGLFASPVPAPEAASSLKVSRRATCAGGAPPSRPSGWPPQAPPRPGSPQARLVGSPGSCAGRGNSQLVQPLPRLQRFIGFRIALNYAPQFRNSVFFLSQFEEGESLLKLC